MDTAGLQVLLLAMREAGHLGKILRLVSVNRVVADVLAIAHLSNDLQAIPLDRQPGGDRPMNYEEELRSALSTFVVEGRELLQDMESSLLGLESESDPTEAINAVFRAAHTIKGSSGLFGLHDMVRFTHVVESVLDRLRTNEIPVSSDLVGALLPCRDYLGVLIEGLADGRLEQTEAEAAQGQALLAELQPFLDLAPADGRLEGPAPEAADQTRASEADQPPGAGGASTSASASGRTTCAAGWTRWPSSGTCRRSATSWH